MDSHVPGSTVNMRRQRTSRYYDIALNEANKPRADLDRVHDLLVRAHGRGDARAAYALGTWYLHGRPGLVEKSLSRAVGLLREAATENHPDALFDLAVCYERGAGVRRSHKKAALLYLRAALCGDKQATHAMGKLYWHGRGVKRDRAIANVWLDFAEKYGISDAAGS